MGEPASPPAFVGSRPGPPARSGEQRRRSLYVFENAPTLYGLGLYVPCADVYVCLVFYRSCEYGTVNMMHGRVSFCELEISLIQHSAKSASVDV